MMGIDPPDGLMIALAARAGCGGGRRWRIGWMRCRGVVLTGVVLTGVVLTGCGSGSARTGSGICTNDFTGLCQACPGVALCVDPKTCLVIDCNSGVLFGDGHGADTVDADPGAVDGALIDCALIDGALIDGALIDGASADGVLSDGGLSDGQALDSEAGDAASSAGDTAPLQADVAATADGGQICTDGIKACLDPKTPQLCFQGQWMTLASCTSGYGCAKGACACAKECVALGQHACEPGVAAVKTCQLDGACLRWGVPLACQAGQICAGGQCQATSGCAPTCAPGQVCQQGACVPVSSGNCTPACAAPQVCTQGKCATPTCTPACAAGQVCNAGTCEPAATGTLACGQIMACVNQFSQGPQDVININACVAKGTATAQAEYLKRKTCIALSCQTLIDAAKVNEAMLCVYTYCAKEQTGCLGSGVKTCSGLGGCLIACGNSVVCTVGCHADASLAGLKAWYLLMTCGEQKCPAKTGNAYATCVSQQCVAPYQTCFGTSGGGGGYSCAQVLQCAGLCGQSKSCAQACKSKASSQGLADLNALLACNDGPCKSACTSGTAQQCSACMKLNCASQQAACN